MLAALLALAAAGGAGAAEYGAGVVRVEVRVLQNVEDGREIHIGARPAAGSWRTLGRIPLALDDGVSATRYRYGDIALDVPLANWASPVTVHVRVWQDVRDDQNIYISARGSLGEWDTLGTISLPLDDGLTPDRALRYGDVRLEVPLPREAVSTLAGQAGEWGYEDARGRAVRFGFVGAFGLAVDQDGSVVVADPSNHAIRRIAPDGSATTIAGGNGPGFRDGHGDVAQFEQPTDVALSPDGSIFVADRGNGRIRKIGVGGAVTTVAGKDPETVSPYSSPADGPALEVFLFEPLALALDASGDLYIAQWISIRRLSPSGQLFTLAGGPLDGYRDGPAEEAQFRFLRDIDVDDAGNVYVLDVSIANPGEPGAFSTVRMVDTTGVVRTLYRSDHPSYGGTLASPSGMAVTGGGEVFLSNTGRHQIVRFGTDGELRGVVGTGEDGFNDGPLGEAQFSYPERLEITPNGELFVTDQGGAVIRRVSPGGDDVPLAVAPHVPHVEGVAVTILSGRVRQQGFVDGAPDRARFRSPEGLAFDPGGALLVADTVNHAIRRVGADGSVTTIAGGNGEGTRDGPRDEAQFASPSHIAVGADGTAYVIEQRSGRIRKVAPDGSVETLSGEVAELSPVEIAADPAGDLYLLSYSLDADSYSVGRLSPDGQISTVVSRVGLGGIAVDAEGVVYYGVEWRWLRPLAIEKASTGSAPTTLVESPPIRYGGLLGHVGALAVAPDGVLYVADRSLARVIRIAPDGAVAIVVDRESFDHSRHFQPYDILLTPDGDLLIADAGMSVIWKITFEDEADE